MGLEPLIAPLNVYELNPLFVTLNTVSNDAVALYWYDDDIITLPLNVENVLTSNPVLGEIDAVAEPEDIFVKSKSFNALTGISNNLAPLPEKDEPETISIPLLPLT